MSWGAEKSEGHEPNGFDHPTIAPSVPYISETLEREVQARLKQYNESLDYNRESIASIKTDERAHIIQVLINLVRLISILMLLQLQSV